jgi:hypothetical protein
MVCMKKTFNIDPELLKEARESCGAKTDTEAIRLGLEALLYRAAVERMIAYAGSEGPAVRDVPRRRPETLPEERRATKSKRRRAA